MWSGVTLDMHLAYLLLIYPDENIRQRDIMSNTNSIAVRSKIPSVFYARLQVMKIVGHVDTATALNSANASRTQSVCDVQTT